MAYVVMATTNEATSNTAAGVGGNFEMGAPTNEASIEKMDETVSTMDEVSMKRQSKSFAKVSRLASTIEADASRTTGIQQSVERSMVQVA